MTFAITSLGLTSIAVKSIKLNSSNIKLQVGKTSTLKVTFTPANATNKKLTYISANKKIATVDKNGIIKGIKAGKTVITVNSSSNFKVVAKCNVTISQVAEPVKLTVWCEYQPGTIQTLNEVFKKLLPDIAVDVQRKEQLSDAMKLVGTDPAGAPDLFCYAHDKLGLWVTLGIIDPLDEYFPADKQADFVPMTLDAVKFNDKIYAMPMYYETLLFMYNKKLLDKAPATTDELLAMMKEKTKDGNYGFVEMYSSEYFAACWYNAFGGFMVNDKSEPGLNSQGFIDAMEYHKQFLPYLDKMGDWGTTCALFLAGKAASTINGPWFTTDVAKAGIELGVAPLPVVSSINKPLAPFSGVQGVHLVKVGNNKEAAIKVIKFLQQKDVSEALGMVVKVAPANLKAYDNEIIKNDPIIPVLKAAAAAAPPMAKVPAMDVMWTVTGNALVAITRNNADIKATLDAAQADAVALIAAMGK